MRIEYKGENKKENIKRHAYISYNANKEQEKVDIIFNKLDELGWELNQEDECACILVYDREDYEQLVSEIHTIKKWFCLL